MPKYEIMMIVDPRSQEEVANMVKAVFKTELESYELLERTELAYEINNVKTANYVLAKVASTGPVIKEFVRRSDLLKGVWRRLVINLETERAVATLAKMQPLDLNAPERSGGSGHRRDYHRGGERGHWREGGERSSRPPYRAHDRRQPAPAPQAAATDSSATSGDGVKH